MTLRSLALAALLSFTAAPVLAQAPTAQDDPFIWLEEVESPRSLAWVEAQNARTRKRLEGDARYEPFRKAALDIFTAVDRIATPDFRAGGVDNFWQDAQRPRGVWRRTSVDGFRAEAPKWETLLDLDALGKAEGRDWVWKGATCLKPEERICLLRLSDGGKDAVEIREYDVVAKRFVEGGFRLPEGKQNVAWLDADTLVVAREWVPGEVTQSGYAYVDKIVKRGQPLEQAREIFRGDKKNVWARPHALYGAGGKVEALLIEQGLSYYETAFFLMTDRGPVALPLPRKASVDALVDGQMVFTIRQDWGGHQAGALLSYDLAALKANPATAKPILVTQPNERQAIEAVESTDSKLVVNLYEDVKGAVDIYDFDQGRWSATRVALPKDASIGVVTTSGKDDRLFATVQGFLDPTTLWLIDGATAKAERVKALPARFKAEGAVVEQFWATSTDGTKVPYFVVRPKAMKLDGSSAVLMYGYGGFQVSKPPVYLSEAGKLWLENGGVYVIANIRGGGEFGPRWHQAVLRDKRQLAFDDFAAVGKDLIARKITSSRRLGIYGRSNGGVLTSVSITQHPELFGAAVIESPLIDMLRYHKLSAGASWVGEYGDPDVPEDYAFIAKYSAYQQLKPGVKYPEPYITTNMKDDRVHPGHARKFAARMEQLGLPYLYFEDTMGGHSYDADPSANAQRWARHYVYLSQKLMD
jgi:prolyl oligopeptidase